MNFFDLPIRTKVGRVIPKNSFDSYTNTKQKKLFADAVQRITWVSKLSSDTVNLNSIDIKEIQVFKIELKAQIDITKVLEIINRAIPYHIIFWVEFNQQAYISAAVKHPHPANEDTSVIDWTFTSEWFLAVNSPYQLSLKGSVDAVFKDLCVHLTGKPRLSTKTMAAILQNQQEIDQLKKEVSRLKISVASSKQFNKKVDLNLQLKTAEKQLKKLKEF